jgi:hypothetical protein
VCECVCGSVGYDDSPAESPAAMFVTVLHLALVGPGRM